MTSTQPLANWRNEALATNSTKTILKESPNPSRFLSNNTIQVRREENSTNNIPVFNDFPESYTETMNLPCRALEVRNGGGI